MKTRSGKPVHLSGYEELLSVPTIAGASDIPLEQLHELYIVMVYDTVSILSFSRSSFWF